MSPSLGIFWNFELQIVTSGIWWKGESCPKMGGGIKVGEGVLTSRPPLVALLLEQAIDASFYELTLPKQLNDLGVGSVELQSILFSLHI